MVLTDDMRDGTGTSRSRCVDIVDLRGPLYTTSNYCMRNDRVLAVIKQSTNVLLFSFWPVVSYMYGCVAN